MDFLGNIGLRLVGLLVTVGILAAVYFFIVKPYNAYQERKGVAATDKDCPHCLSSIPLNANRCAFCTQPV